MSDPAPANDPIDELRAHVRATREAAERLRTDADNARRDARAGRTPPAGWASPGEQQERAAEVHAMARLLQALRELVPDELQAQLTEVVRQLLLLARAIIEWWVERLELDPAASPDVRPRPTEPRVQEVPIA